MAYTYLLPDWYYSHVFGFEGGIVNDPDDYGGLTNRGITYGTYQILAKKVYGVEPSMAHYKSLTINDGKKMLDEFCRESGASLVDNMALRAAITEISWGAPALVGSICVQVCINNGFKLTKSSKYAARFDAARWINTQSSDIQAKIFAEMMAGYWQSLLNQIQRDPTQAKFKNGWKRRIDAMIKVGNDYLVKKKLMKLIGPKQYIWIYLGAVALIFGSIITYQLTHQNK